MIFGFAWHARNPPWGWSVCRNSYALEVLGYSVTHKHRLIDLRAGALGFCQKQGILKGEVSQYC